VKNLTLQPLRSFAKEAQDDKEFVLLFVILNEVKNLALQLLRSFAKAAQDDKKKDAQDDKIGLSF